MGRCVFSWARRSHKPTDTGLVGCGKHMSRKPLQQQIDSLAHDLTDLEIQVERLIDEVTDGD